MGLFDFVGKVVKGVTDTASKIVDTGIKTVEKTTGIDLPGGYTRAQISAVRSKPTTTKTTTSAKTAAKTTPVSSPAPVKSPSPVKSQSTATTSTPHSERRSSSRSHKRSSGGGTSYSPWRPQPSIQELTKGVTKPSLLEKAANGEAEDVILITNDKGQIVGYSDLDRQMTIVGTPRGNYRVHGVYNPKEGYVDAPYTAPVDNPKEAKTLYHVVKYYSGDEQKAYQKAVTAATLGGQVAGSRNPEKPDMRDKIFATTRPATQFAQKRVEKEAQEAERAVAYANAVAKEYDQAVQKYNAFAESARTTLEQKRQRVEELEKLLNSYPKDWRPQTKEQYEHYMQLYKEYKAAVDDYNQYIREVKAKDAEWQKTLSWYEKQYKEKKAVAEKELAEFESAKKMFVDTSLSEAFYAGKILGQESAYYNTPKGQKELFEMAAAKEAYDFYEKFNKMNPIDKAKTVAAMGVIGTFLTPADKGGLAQFGRYLEELAKTGSHEKAAAAARQVFGEELLHLKSLQGKDNKVDVGKFATSFVTSPGTLILSAPLAGEAIGGGSTILAARSATAQKILGSTAFRIGTQALAYGGVGYHTYMTYERTGSVGRAAAVGAVDLSLLKLFESGAREGAAKAQSWLEQELMKSQRITTVVGKDMRFANTDKLTQVYGKATTTTKVTSGWLKGRTITNTFQVNTSITPSETVSTGLSVSVPKGGKPTIIYHAKMSEADVINALKQAGIQIAGSSEGVSGFGMRSGAQIATTYISKGNHLIESTPISKFAQFEVSNNGLTLTRGVADVFTEHGRYLMHYGAYQTDKVLRMMGLGASSKELVAVDIVAKRPTVNLSEATRGITPSRPCTTSGTATGGGLTMQVSKIAQMLKSPKSVAGTITSFAEAGAANVKSFVSELKALTVLAPPTALSKPQSKATAKGKGTAKPTQVIAPPSVKSDVKAVTKAMGKVEATEMSAVKQLVKEWTETKTTSSSHTKTEAKLRELVTTVQKLDAKPLQKTRVAPKLATKTVGVPKMPRVIPPMPVPPAWRISVSPRFLLGGSGTGGGAMRPARPRKVRQVRSIFDVFPKPTLYTADKMIKEFGRVVIPKSPKVKKAYWAWIKSGAVGEFNPLAVLKKDTRGAKPPKATLPKLFGGEDKQRTGRNKKSSRKNMVGGLW